ncbi:DUF5985 family protein [Sphingomonas sp.]|jgi:uncharacterized integral membrane protein|uniref:DUF5985 family protein n=1 Tax=Sphingomonas sp. TaxID=28214 RepID=UPI002DE8C724|nr:DUF5985 family protein [Sphingomonas sp.]
MTDQWFPGIVYTLCFLTSAACTWLLLRAYLASRSGLLFWSAGCFLLLALNNLIVIFDLLIVRSADLLPWRVAASLAAVCLLLFGFIWRGEEA